MASDGGSRSSSAADSYIGSLISLTSKSEIRYEGVLYNINTEESSIGLRNVRSFGTEGRKKDGQQIPPSDKVFEYILFRGSDIKDLQVKSSPPVQSTSINNDPAIIQSHYPQPVSTSTSLPSAVSGSLPDVSSHYPGSGLPLYQPGGTLGSWGASPAPNINGAGVAMPMYWQGYYGHPNGLAHLPQQSLLRPPPGLPMHPLQQQMPPPLQQQMPPAHQPPMLPAHQQPMLPAHQQPMLPAHQQPMLPAHQQPMLPAHQQPMLPAHQQPMPPAHQQPMPPAHQQPMPPAHQQPMPPAHQHPMPPAHQQPMPPAYHQPMPPAHQQPMRQSHQQPMPQSHQQPMPPALHQPLQHHPMPSPMQHPLLSPMQHPLLSPMQHPLLSPMQQPVLSSMQQYPNFNASLPEPTGASNLPEFPSSFLNASTSSSISSFLTFPAALPSDLSASHASEILPLVNKATNSSLPPAPLSTNFSSLSPLTISSIEAVTVGAPIINKPNIVPSPALPYQTGSLSISSISVSRNSKQSQTSIPSLVTPCQLMQSGPTEVPALRTIQTAHKDVEVVLVSSSEQPGLVSIDAQPPILPLPVPSRSVQKPNNTYFQGRPAYRGRERGRGTGSSHSVTNFTEDFDFTAMNEKFNKDEVWGHLGKGNKSSPKDEFGDGKISDEDDSLDDYDGQLPKVEVKPQYNKDDFFDSISCNALENGGQYGRMRYTDQIKMDTETFGDFPRYRGGRGGRGFVRGGRSRGHYGRGYGHAGRGRGRTSPNGASYRTVQ